MERVVTQRLCFPPAVRIRTKAGYRQVMSDPQRISLPHLLILYRDNHQTFSRLGLAIARKHVNTAVGRNRIKRLVRESFRHHRQELGGVDIVVLTRPRASAGSKQVLRAELQTAWGKIRHTACAIS